MSFSLHAPNFSDGFGKVIVALSFSGFAIVILRTRKYNVSKEKER